MLTQRPDTVRAAAYATALTLAASALPAFAHHVMGGQTPQTFGQGLLSGVAHPLIDIGHFAFVIAVGITAALTGRIWTLAIAFVAGTLAGCFVHLAGVTLPVAELVIAATVLLLGAIIADSARQQRSVDDCARRFRSYDPYSRTYLGHDGYRHSCP